MIRNFALLSILSAASAAQAIDVVTFSGSNVDSLPVSINFNGVGHYVQAGPLNVSVNGGSSFEAYCVDLANSISNGDSWQVTTSTTANPSLNNGLRLGQIYNKYAGSVSSADLGAALQLALWDVVVDGGNGLGVGNFQATSPNAAVTTQFNAIIADALTGISSNTNYYTAVSHPNNRNQNLIGGTTPNAAPVPEPASMAVLGLGLAALKRRRNAKK